MKAKKEPVIDWALVRILFDYKENDADFEYFWDIATTKIQYFLRHYENEEDWTGKKKVIRKMMYYLIEKWERHIRFNNEFPDLVKKIKKLFNEQRKRR